MANEPITGQRFGRGGDALLEWPAATLLGTGCNRVGGQARVLSLGQYFSMHFFLLLLLHSVPTTVIQFAAAGSGGPYGACGMSMLLI